MMRKGLNTPHAVLVVLAPRRGPPVCRTGTGGAVLSSMLKDTRAALLGCEVTLYVSIATPRWVMNKDVEERAMSGIERSPKEGETFIARGSRRFLQNA